MAGTHSLLAAGLALALSACAVGPDYRAPGQPVPDRWQAAGPATSQTAGDDAALGQWWSAFDDPLLTQFIERALADNKSVHQAMARVKESRARAGIANAGLWPTLDASASGSRTTSDTQRISEDGSGFTLDDESYAARLDARWELDLFGAKRRSREAATAQLDASEADLRDVLVTLLSDVALGYLNVRTTQARLTYAERNLAAQSEVLEIARIRAEAGLATVLDVEQATASYEQTRAQIPSLGTALAQAKHRLAVLLGQPPAALAEQLAPRAAIPVAPKEIVAGVPADLLRRRPDIRVAERRLAAQTAQVGVATAALYPSLSLSGSISLDADTAGDLLSDGLQTDRYGLSISMPIFRAGALRQNIRVQNALVDQALANYEAAVLAAYEEVENALTAWANEQRRYEALVEAAASARRASELALIRYNSGLVDFTAVLNADRTLISTEDSLAVSEGELTSNLIRLYKALGGGWSVFPAGTGQR